MVEVKIKIENLLVLYRREKLMTNLHLNHLFPEI